MSPVCLGAKSNLPCRANHPSCLPSRSHPSCLRQPASTSQPTVRARMLLSAAQFFGFVSLTYSLLRAWIRTESDLHLRTLHRRNHSVRRISDVRDSLLESFFGCQSVRLFG